MVTFISKVEFVQSTFLEGKKIVTMIEECFLVPFILVSCLLLLLYMSGLRIYLKKIGIFVVVENDSVFLVFKHHRYTF